MVKPNRSFSALICTLPALIALTGCAHQIPASRGAVTVTAIPAVASLPAEAAANPNPDAATAASAAADATAPASATETPAKPADHSLVAPPPGDLFVRLRGGFKLEDVDQGAIDREQNWFANNPDYLDRVWGRAGMYLHYIVGELNQRSMPLELALLPVVESAFEPYAYSRARASGLWQFIPGTGSLYGLKQDWWYDGRRDVVASTRAALDYLQSLHDQFDGDWLLAIAAYNCGAGNVQRAVSHNLRAGKPIDFWHLKLPTETRAYVPKLLAMRRIVADPASFGLEFSQIPDEPYFTQVATGGQIDMQVAAEIAGIPKNDLYELNPAFHRFATDPTGPHMLLVPTEFANGLEQTLLSLTPEQRLRAAAYEVRRGDTVASIAKQFSTTPAVVRELNGMGSDDKPVIGGWLHVPSSDVVLPEKAARAAALFDRPGRMGGRRSARGGVHVVRRGDTLYGIALRMGTNVHTLARLNNMEVGDTLRAGQHLVVSSRAGRDTGSRGSHASAPGSGRQVTYTVRRGDTLYGIARLLQVTVRDLMGWNTTVSSNGLRPGQKLVAFVASRS
ncbi:MAG: LysM peptidoglycan-binding domain-containing protein [Steroidobacteraceae bacterium]